MDPNQRRSAVNRNLTGEDFSRQEAELAKRDSEAIENAEGAGRSKAPVDKKRSLTSEQEVFLKRYAGREIEESLRSIRLEKYTVKSTKRPVRVCCWCGGPAAYKCRMCTRRYCRKKCNEQHKDTMCGT
eukprot:TRINITY_DN9286_c0_g1_i1.p2 TRINITY_DN9286_c0_g1~~TRINITY_DN9286_c0_g1_i1.p2  ORF type:complete len:128 (+),score=26.44 TRINITY_DN9286_c0_g1_i1:161-544(+)